MYSRDPAGADDLAQLVPIGEEASHGAVSARRERAVVHDLPGTTRDGDIHEMGDDMRGVWFKDPSGNIISVVNAT